MAFKDSKDRALAVQYSERYQRRKHRKDTRAFLWCTWIMLFLAAAIGYPTWQGFRTGRWVDISSDDSGLMVPWWLAAIVVLAFLLASLWCFAEYLKLTRTAPQYQPGDEDNGDD